MGSGSTSLGAARPRPRRAAPSVESLALSEVGNEVRRVRRAEAGHRIPAVGGRVARDGRDGLIVAGRDVEEVVRVPRRVVADLVQRRVDQPEPVAGDLGREGDDAGPLREGEGGAADVVPACAARVAVGADQPLCPSGGSVRDTSAPVRELAWKPTSGTPRCVGPIGVLPAGSESW